VAQKAYEPMSSTPEEPTPPRQWLRRCYVASPLGFSEAGRSYYAEVLLPALADVVTPVDPWALTPPEDIDRARAAGTLPDLILEIGRRNVAAIRSSELLVAVLDGQEPDSGTVAELGYAAALGKMCFGLRSDLRQAGEDGAVVNLQVQTFIVDSGGQILPSLAQLVMTLRDAASR
jgi:nucleoside 2-deoxyribosyltransferase